MKLSSKSMATNFCAKIFGGGFCLYINEDIPSKQIHTKLLEGLEYIYIEMNLRKRKWLVIGIYKLPQSCGKMFIEGLSNQFDDLHKSYGNILLLDDFNMTLVELQYYCDTHDLENLIKEPTCFKGKNPTYINLILTNQKQLFMKSRTFITSISDFHALTTCIMKLTYTKGNSKIKFYRDYKKFDNDLCHVDLENGLRNLTVLTYTSFEEAYLRTLGYHSPIKKKLLRANENSFISKALRKAIMMRSIMKNSYLKNKTDLNRSNYKKQRNLCTILFRKTKKEYFLKFDIIKISDSKIFWKTIKHFFSDKGLNCNKMMLSENDQIISDETTIC